MMVPMSGVLLLSLLKTSRRYDYHLSLSVTVFTAAVALWVAVGLRAPWGAAPLGILTVVLAGTTLYARSLWRREHAAHQVRLDTLKVRAPR